MAIDAYIDTSAFRQVFASGDCIKGKVVINLAKETSIQRIVVTHRVTVSTDFKVYEEATQYTVAKVVNAHDQHKIYEREVVVFPTPEMQSQVKSKSFTLSPGSHSYDFSIVIPGGKQDKFVSLPPSWIKSQWPEGKVEHVLKASIQRSGPFHSDTNLEQRINFTPRSNIKFLERDINTSLARVVQFNNGAAGFFSFSQGEPGKYTGSAIVECGFPAVIKQHPFTIPLTVSARSIDGVPIVVGRVSCDLISETVYFAQGKTTKNTQNFIIVRDSNIYYGSDIELSDHYADLKLSQVVEPTFDTMLLSRKYRLKIIVNVCDADRKVSQEISFDEPVVVLSNEFHDDVGAVDLKQFSKPVTTLTSNVAPDLWQPIGDSDDEAVTDIPVRPPAYFK